MVRNSTRAHVLKAFLIASTAIIPAASIAMAQAQTTAAAQPASFDIPAQSLSDSLAAFARATGMRIVYPAELAQGRSAPALRGSHTHTEALSQILSGSGLGWRFTGGNAVTIFDPSTTADVQVDADGSLLLDTITVAGASSGFSADTPYETAGASAFVTGEQIARISPVSPGDMLKGVSGVTVANNRAGVSMDVNIRGLQGMSRVNTMIDGAMQQSSSYKGYDGHESRVYVDPELIAGVEVQKGPVAGPHGAGAIGGSVNMRTLNAHDIVNDGKSIGARVRLSAGGNMIEMDPSKRRFSDIGRDVFSPNANHVASVAIGAVDDRFELLLAGATRKQGNYFAGTNGQSTISYTVNNRNYTVGLSPYGPGFEVFNTYQDSRSALGRLTIHLTDEQSLEFSANLFQSTFGEMNTNSLVLIGRPVIYGASNVDSRTYTARYAWSPAENPLFDLRANLWATDVNLFSASTTLDASILTLGGELHNTSKIDVLEGLDLNYGVQFFQEDTKSASTDGTINSLWDDMSGVRRMSSGFVTAKLDANTWLSFGAGLRYDTFNLTDTGPAANPALSGSRLSPSASVTVTPLDGVQLFAAYSEGWKPPSTREAFVMTGTGIGANPVVPNPDLRPELARNKEVGLNISRDDLIAAGDRLRLKATYFDNNYNDYIIRVLTPGVGYQFDNIPGVQMKGIDLSLNYDAGWVFGEATYNHYTDIKYCFTAADGCIAQTGSTDYESAYVPPKYSGSVTLGLRLFEEKFKLGGRMSFVGERAIAKSSSASAANIPDWLAYQTYDIFGGYQFSENASLDFSIENVGDLYYVDALSKGIAAPGRTFRASLTAKF